MIPARRRWLRFPIQSTEADDRRQERPICSIMSMYHANLGMTRGCRTASPARSSSNSWRVSRDRPAQRPCRLGVPVPPVHMPRQHQARRPRTKRPLLDTRPWGTDSESAPSGKLQQDLPRRGKNVRDEFQGNDHDPPSLSVAGKFVEVACILFAQLFLDSETTTTPNRERKLQRRLDRATGPGNDSFAIKTSVSPAQEPTKLRSTQPPQLGRSRTRALLMPVCRACSKGATSNGSRA